MHMILNLYYRFLRVFLIWDFRAFACFDMLEGEVLFLEINVSVGRFALQKLIIAEGVLPYSGKWPFRDKL